MTFTVVIGTYGDGDAWGPLAQRAAASVMRQTVGAEVVLAHRETLAIARNAGASLANSEWLVFLDADDQLDASYIAAMAAAADETGADLLQPATLGVYPDGREDEVAVVIPPRTPCFLDGNHLIIGTAVRKAMFEAVGGFEEWPLYEDWELWLRCWMAGATQAQVPAAIYRVGVNDGSRNSPDRAIQVDTYQQIRHRHLAKARSLGLA